MGVHSSFTYYLSLGSNLGEREQTLNQAIDMINDRIGCVRARSSYYYSEPWGFESKHSFCNICLRIETNRQPLEVLHLTQDIERSLGRQQKSQNGEYHDRTIDIDLLLCLDGDHSLERCTPELVLPHPLMNERDFVMIPLREICPCVQQNK